MSESSITKYKDLWPKNGAIYIEMIVIILIALFSLFLLNGSINATVLLSYHAIITIIGSLSVWFVNRIILERILQSKIESAKITRSLPFDLLLASILVTSIIYILIYLILLYIEQSDFVFVYFLQGFSGTIVLSLLIVMLYVGSQLWTSWWSDGDFLFQNTKARLTPSKPKNVISIKNSKGTTNVPLKDVYYFISESKIVFLVDISCKKWITQYNLSDLEKIFEGQFFRLNRKIMVSRHVISQIKKLPNHRLLVTIGPKENQHFETVSRYKSTQFKQWYHNGE